MSTDLPEPDAAEAVFSDEDGVLYDEEVTPEYGILGFTLRELLIVGIWLVSFVLSLFPLSGGLSLWGIGIEWILPVGVPTVAVFLLVLRRFSPDGIRRVGSLGIDQFASVAFSVAACVWAGNLWLAVSAVMSTGHWGLPWNALLLVITSFALVVLTVFAPLIPGLKEDFHGRLVTLAHRNANPVRPVIARPRPERPEPDDSTDGDGTSATDDGATPAISGAGAVIGDGETAVIDDPRGAAIDDIDDDTTQLPVVGQAASDEEFAAHVPLSAHASGGGTGTMQVVDDEDYVPTYSRRSRSEQPQIVSDTGSMESLLETAARVETGEVPTDEESTADIEATNPREPAHDAQPFWILAQTERDVHDERGESIFRIGPNAWALVIEDRGGAYVVRHDDGRIGYLHDISDITKG